jgi:hypothetical protein
VSWLKGLLRGKPTRRSAGQALSMAPDGPRPRDEIEFGEPTASTCGCCGGVTTHLVRFVSRDERAFAVYFADFAHEDFVSVLVGFGDWGDDAPPSGRTAFAFRIWTSNNSYQVGIVEPGDTHWETDYLGKKLSREAALGHELIQEVFDLSDHIIECDRPIIDYLESLPRETA